MRVGVLTDRRYLEQAMPLAVVRALGQRAVHPEVIVPEGCRFDPATGLVQDQTGRTIDLNAYSLLLARTRDPLGLAMLGYAEVADIRTINSSSATERVRNKAQAAVILSRAGLPCAPTLLAREVAGLAQLPQDAFPLILKPPFGDNGLGLRLVRSPAELAKVRWGEGPVLAQRYLAHAGIDLKLYVCGRMVCAVRKPSPFDGDPGTPPQLARLDHGLMELALRCGRIFGLELYGVDTLETPDGLAVIEVNEFPNFTGVPGAADLLAEYVLTRGPRSRVLSHVGKTRGAVPRGEQRPLSGEPGIQTAGVEGSAPQTRRCRTAVVFGAGKLAGGLLGHLLARSGYAIQLVARRPEVIEAVNRRASYTLTIGGVEDKPVSIRGCRALSIRDRARVTHAVAGADVVFTAVGADSLSAIAPLIAEGLNLRGRGRPNRPLNVIACENLPGAGAYFRHEVVSAAPLDGRLTVERIGGFSAAVTPCIMTGGTIEDGELRFYVDSAYELIVDRQGLNGPLPPLDGVLVTDEFAAYVMRKFFLLNCAQAMAAYLGYREGCRYVQEAATHPHVAPLVRQAVAEAEAALRATLPRHAAGIRRDAAAALERISAAQPADLISRVARDPRRKLALRERLVGPARLADQRGLPYEALSRGIAAALAYDAPDDPQAIALQRTIATDGLEMVLTEDCGLLPYGELARAIKRQWRGLTAARERVRASWRGLTGARPGRGYARRTRADRVVPATAVT